MRSLRFPIKVLNITFCEVTFKTCSCSIAIMFNQLPVIVRHHRKYAFYEIERIDLVRHYSVLKQRLLAFIQKKPNQILP